MAMTKVFLCSLASLLVSLISFKPVSCSSLAPFPSPICLLWATKGRVLCQCGFYVLSVSNDWHILGAWINAKMTELNIWFWPYYWIGFFWQWVKYFLLNSYCWWDEGNGAWQQIWMWKLSTKKVCLGGRLINKVDAVAVNDTWSRWVTAKGLGGLRSCFLGRIVPSFVLSLTLLEHSYWSIHEKNSPQRILVWGKK